MNGRVTNSTTQAHGTVLGSKHTTVEAGGGGGGGGGG